MKENIILIAALIVIGTTVFVAFLMIGDLITTRKTKQKEKEMWKLKLDMQKGDKKAELKLNEQLLFFEEKYETAKERVKTAEKNLENFKTMFNLLDPEIEEETILVKLPKNLSKLSFEDKEKRHDVFLMHNDLENYLETQKIATDQKG